MKSIMILIVSCVALVVVAQVVPYGRDHRNPPVIQEPIWNSADTRGIAQRACFDCHSNETKWPWYSNIAPISWMLQRDVNAGRAELNFSRWDRPQGEAEDVAKVVRNGEMPPRSYLMLHPEARLTHAERNLLANDLQEVMLKRPAAGYRGD